MNIFDLTPLGRQEKWEESSGGWPRTEAHFAVIQKDEPDEQRGLTRTGEYRLPCLRTV